MQKEKKKITSIGMTKEFKYNLEWQETCNRKWESDLLKKKDRKNTSINLLTRKKNHYTRESKL